MNYVDNKTTDSVTYNTTPSTIISVTITTTGAPVLIGAAGDANPLNPGGWCVLTLARDGIPIGKRIQCESSASNENVPYNLQYIDTPDAGTYTYSLVLLYLPTTDFYFQFGEQGGPYMFALEIGRAHV